MRKLGKRVMSVVIFGNFDKIMNLVACLISHSRWDLRNIMNVDMLGICVYVKGV